MAAAFRALKPGGILGVVEHRNNDPNFVPKTPGQGYVGEQYAIDLIQSAGFRLVGQSNVNRNPKDTKDYPKGVWTLPPTLCGRRQGPGPLRGDRRIRPLHAEVHQAQGLTGLRRALLSGGWPRTGTRRAVRSHRSSSR